MNEADKRTSKRAPVALRVKLGYRSLDTFVSKFATNISTTGMFIRSRKPKPAGTHLRFELRLADESIVIAGNGRIAWVRPYQPTAPKEPHGMGIAFTSLSKDSKALVSRIVTLGSGETDDIPYAVKEDALVQIISENTTSALPHGGDRHLSRARAHELTLSNIDHIPVDLQDVLLRAKELASHVNTTMDEELASLAHIRPTPNEDTFESASQDLTRVLGLSSETNRASQTDTLDDAKTKSDAKPLEKLPVSSTDSPNPHPSEELPLIEDATPVPERLPPQRWAPNSPSTTEPNRTKKTSEGTHSALAHTPPLINTHQREDTHTEFEIIDNESIEIELDLSDVPGNH